MTPRKASGAPRRRKAPEPREATVTQARAIQRYIRQSPRKMRLVADLIRGKNVNEAYGILKFSKKLAAKQIEKTLRSAVANAEQAALKANESLDVDELRVTKATVDMGTPLKRWASAAQGRGVPIRKPTSHLLIIVGTKESK